MYDFDNDGYITAEDVRIMMSYMPFNREIIAQNVQSIIDQRGMKASMNDSPSRRRESVKEGLYQETDGKNVDYADRIHD